MSMDKPYLVEVTVDAPRDEVWRALTETEKLRHWFGWEYDGLDEEIQYIVEHAELHPPDRIGMGFDSAIELVDLGPRTLIRAIKPGDLTAAEWADVYGGIEEGWITFLHQLRHRITFAPDSNRRMIVRSGTLPGVPSLPGVPWHESQFQRGADVDGTLIVVFVKPDGEAMLLVTTYDLDDEAFATAEAHWSSWWDALPR